MSCEFRTAVSVPRPSSASAVSVGQLSRSIGQFRYEKPYCSKAKKKKKTKTKTKPKNKETYGGSYSRLGSDPALIHQASRLDPSLTTNPA
jgi:hypothetical protein